MLLVAGADDVEVVEDEEDAEDVNDAEEVDEADEAEGVVLVADKVVLLVAEAEDGKDTGGDTGTKVSS